MKVMVHKICKYYLSDLNLLGICTYSLHYTIFDGHSNKNFDLHVTFLENMIKVEFIVVKQYGYLCLWAPSCDFLMNVEIEDPFIKF